MRMIECEMIVVYVEKYLRNGYISQKRGYRHKNLKNPVWLGKEIFK